MSTDLLCMLLFLCLNQFHKNFKARHQQHHIKIKRGKKEGITTLIRYKDMEIHIDVPKYFKIKELLKYCSSIISIGVTPCKKQQRSTKEDADDRWCIKHVWRLMWKPRSINCLLVIFLSWGLKKAIVIPISWPPDLLRNYSQYFSLLNLASLFLEMYQQRSGQDNVSKRKFLFLNMLKQPIERLLKTEVLLVIRQQFMRLDPRF